MTAEGKVLIANACTHPDLFWALKGGGGGSFGVVTKVTLATHELARVRRRRGGQDPARSPTPRFAGSSARSCASTRSRSSTRTGASRRSSDRTTRSSIRMVFARADRRAGAGRVEAVPRLRRRVTRRLRAVDPLGVGTMPARHWWDAEWRRQYTPDVDGQPIRGAARRRRTCGGPATRARSTPSSTATSRSGCRRRCSRSRTAWPTRSSRRRASYDVQLHFNKGLGGAPAEQIAAARDTATNPAVLDAFALVIIATGAPHSNPGVPGHEPDLVKGRDGGGRRHRRGGPPARDRPRRRRVREREQLPRQEVPEVLLGPQLRRASRR